MASSIIEITCPRCGHKWTENVEELKKRQDSIYKGVIFRQAGLEPKVLTFRVQCPNDSTWVIVDVKEAPDG